MNWEKPRCLFIDRLIWIKILISYPNEIKYLPLFYDFNKYMPLLGKKHTYV